MRWSCVPSKKLVAEPSPVVPEPSPVVPEVVVKKCSSCNCAPCAPLACAPVRCAPVACAPVACAPLACAPVRCVPLRCWKSSQPLVLRSTPPAETEKQSALSAASVPDAIPGQVSST